MKDVLDKVLLLVAAIVVKLIFMIYKMFAWLVPLATLALSGWLVYRGLCSYWWAAVALILVLLSTYMLYHYAEDSLPESVGAGGWVNRLSDRFIAWIGTLKFFTSPFSLVEDPGSYKIKGTDIREILDGKKQPPPGDIGPIQPGDILLRGFDGYVDGELIRRTGGAQGSGKYFSHAALYVGPLDNENDKAIVARRLQVPDGAGGWREATEAEKDKFRNDPGYFQPGTQMVIHSMSKGVHVEDILTFVRCDYLIVLRLPEVIYLSEQDAGNKPLVELTSEAFDIDTDLVHGKHIHRQVIVKAARHSALGRIGSGYDFQFDNCRTFNRFSCSEFVYYCYKSVHRYIGLKPKKHAFAGLFARITVSPTDIYEAAAEKNKLQIVWKNVP